MKKVLGIAMTLVALLAVLSGCQLASESADNGRDWLIGVYLTPEPIKGQVYGEKTILENGDWEYTFPGIEGIPFYYAPQPHENGGYSWVCNQTAGVQGSHATMRDGIVTDLEGYFYLTTEQEEHIWYLNPMYWQPDEAVYLKPDQDPFRGSVMDGGSVGIEKSESFTYEIGGNTQTRTKSVVCNVSGINPVEKIVVVELDKDYQLIEKTELDGDDLPETFAVDRAANYLLTEHHYSHVHVDREILALDPREPFDGVGIDIQRVQALGYFLPDVIELQWK